MASMCSDLPSENGKVVLMGASGQVGQMVRLMWPNRDELVCPRRRAQPGIGDFDQCLDADEAAQEMGNARSVVCLSGVTPARAKSTGDAYSLNIDLALAAVRAAHEAGVGRVFLASTAAVYGRASGVQSESTACQPESDYGRSKFAMELAALAAAADLGQAVTVLRIGNVAGADAILGCWHAAMEIDRLPDGHTPRRSYIGPDTLARAIHALTQVADLPDVINVAAPGAVEMGALLDAAELSWLPRIPSEDVIESVELSTKKIERYADFAAQNSSAAGLVAEWRQFLLRSREQ